MGKLGVRESHVRSVVCMYVVSIHDIVEVCICVKSVVQVHVLMM